MARKKIIEICQTTGVKTRVLPTTEELIEKQGAMNSLRDVEIEDLLGRDAIKLDNKNISTLIKDKTVLVVTHDIRKESLSWYDGIIRVEDTSIYIDNQSRIA